MFRAAHAHQHVRLVVAQRASTIRLAACLARTRLVGRATSAASSGKIETLRFQIGGEAEAFRHRKLARDVLAPADAVARRIDVVVLQAAGGDRFARAAAFVVGGDFGFQRAVVVALAMHHDRRAAGASTPGGGTPASRRVSPATG